MPARTVLIALTLALAAAPALAHEKGALRLGKKELTTGSNLDLRGERLPKNATITLQLRGTLETFALGEVKTDSAGKFSSRLGLPQEARAGNYTVVAVAADGDKIAEAPLVIIAAPPPSADSMPPAHDMATHGAANTAPEATDSPHARAELMDLEISNSGIEWGLILALVGASGLGGVILLRNPGGR